MNRPLKRKLENALIAFLDASKAGTAFENTTLVSGHATSLADEIALDADPAAVVAVEEPPMPYLVVFVQTRADADLPGVSSFELVCHYKHDATAPGQRRGDVDEILHALLDLITRPTDADSLTDDANQECGAFLAFANIDPDAEAPDTRPDYRRPLHVYDLSPTAENTLFDDTAWHDQLSFAGVAQDLNSRDSES
jgi:hypothetical protein